MDRDPLLRRLERNALIWCIGAAVLALAARLGRPDIALGVLGGGGLIAVSYWAIKSGIDGLMRASKSASGGAIPTRSIAFALLKFVGRYALLGFLAYVMIARLRLHPIGLLVGASSLFAGATFEAFRGGRRSLIPDRR
jgi:hypothetical protein